MIGFYYGNVAVSTSGQDWRTRYGGKVFHKPALAYKQNEIDLDKKISQFERSWKNKFSEIVCMGYSFGESDMHVFRILDRTMLNQTVEKRVGKSKIDEIPKIKFKIFNYNLDESENLKNKIIRKFTEIKRHNVVEVFGNGFNSTEQELINFSLLDY